MKIYDDTARKLALAASKAVLESEASTPEEFLRVWSGMIESRAKIKSEIYSIGKMPDGAFTQDQVEAIGRALVMLMAFVDGISVEDSEIDTFLEHCYGKKIMTSARAQYIELLKGMAPA